MIMQYFVDHDLSTGRCVSLPVPERSQLFALSPVEDPAEQRESLISLVVRTCRAHSVNPRRLITKVLAKTRPEIAALAYPTFFNRLSGTINGHGKYARLFVQALEEVTGQEGLARSTLLPWKDVFPHNGQGMLVRHPRWCSACLLEQRRSREDIYFPLLWSLETYRQCAIHGEQLDDRCPYCERRQPFLPRYPDQAVCHHCLRSLIHSPVPAPRDVGSAVSQFDIWVAKAWANMLAQHDDPSFSPSASQFHTAIRGKVKSLADGNRAAFCRAIGFSEYALKNWLTKGERPSVTQFLALSYAIQSLPSTLLVSACNVSDKTRMPPIVRLPCKLKIRKPRPKTCPQLQAELGALLQAMLQSEPPQPLSAIAKGYGVTAQYLRYHFPELCTQLANRYKQYTRLRSASRLNAQCFRVQDIICTLRNAKHYPSRRKVDAILRREGVSLGKRGVFEAYQAALLA